MRSIESPQRCNLPLVARLISWHLHPIDLKWSVANSESRWIISVICVWDQWKSRLIIYSPQLSKQSPAWWFETPWRLLWRHCNGTFCDWTNNYAIWITANFAFREVYLSGFFLKHIRRIGGDFRTTLNVLVWCLYIKLLCILQSAWKNSRQI